MGRARNRLALGLRRSVGAHETRRARVSGRFQPGLLSRPRQARSERLEALFPRMKPALGRSLSQSTERLAALSARLKSADPGAPLARGFARVHKADGRLVRLGAAPTPGHSVPQGVPVWGPGGV